MNRTDHVIIFMAWGKKYVDEVMSCIENSMLPDCDIVLITDKVTDVEEERLNVVRVDFKLSGLARKAELLDYIPKGYKSYLFLDSDTIVISDISAGFEKAELHGIAMSPAPHYSLDWFWGFDEVMKSEGVKTSGQLQYNTGVIFFLLNTETVEVFRKWFLLAEKYSHICENDQPYFSLAMEECDFNPYTLSIGYNYRGFGDAISGVVRIWHSHDKMPEDINNLECGWPPRRVVEGKMHHTKVNKGRWYLDPPAWLK
ncbi:MAG: hypothetical protein OQK69_01150 [Gammaproteobacteria bacterium]|nr:hypothetical protein [Gammaproteobacteria bacterium]